MMKLYFGHMLWGNDHCSVMVMSNSVFLSYAIKLLNLGLNCI